MNEQRMEAAAKAFRAAWAGSITDDLRGAADTNPSHDPDECFTCHFYWPCRYAKQKSLYEAVML